MAVYGYSNCFEESASAVTATNSVTLGTRRHSDGVDYVYAYNQGNSMIYPGYGVIASLCSGYSVTLSSVTGDMCFGIVHNATATTGTYFWLAQRGFVKAEVGDTVIGNHTAATGMPIALMSLGKFYAVTSGATGSTWNYTQCGYTVDCIETATSGRVYINIA
jgi:hypothetical protein